MRDSPEERRGMMRPLTEGAMRAGAHLWANIRLMVVLVAGLWMIEVADQLLRRVSPERTLDIVGITPRTVRGLAGIVLAPFVHAGFGHLLNNTLPLLILGWIVLLGGRWLFFKVSAIVILCAGAGTWLFGRADSLQLGASGVIYGYLGFLLARGFLELSVRWVIVSVIVGVLYSGALGGFLPGTSVSIAGHVFGFVGGLLAGWLLFFLPRRRAERRARAASAGG